MAGMIPTHHSPSSLNLFAASPSMYVLERVLGKRQPVGAPAHRGTAVEAGIHAGLIDPLKDVAECVTIALSKYDFISALSSDARRGTYREDIPAMVKMGLDELRPYGVPTASQGKVEWHPDGLESPILGYFDWEWSQHGIITDCKTTGKMPSQVRPAHARQVALYAGDNADGRVSYITPKKHTTYRIDNIREHRAALHQIALKLEKFLSLSDDPEFFVSITAPDLESFYWDGPAARQLAYEHWAI